ncbi:HesA/MoeB/ThiF family protein [Ascidiimonas aurantiaca]|uniref:HesA/MoeB/ThiF family protein n=1 Tax=Ascidiimonas aurantiaca TaxID=1685432 RepID=UPI0030EB4B52
MKENRYIRQISLKSFGEEAQRKLGEASVLVVGAGGLGLPVLQYLNAMGVGKLGIVEYDRVALSNLHRQIAYTEADVKKPKIEVITRLLKAQNTQTGIKPFPVRLTAENALTIISQFDVVADCSDNFATRYLVNDACVLLKKPFVYGALHAFEGQVSVFNYKQGPTYRCLFPKPPSLSEIPDCNTNGVLGVLPGIIGNLQALEVIKVITGIGKVTTGILLLYDTLEQQLNKIRFSLVPENKEITKLQNTYVSDHCIADNCKTIDMDTFIREFTENPQKQIIDVRTPREFKDFSLKGAINIPLSALPGRHYEIDNKKNIYFICQSGERSLQAANFLRTAYRNATVFSVEGGMDAYSQNSQQNTHKISI